MSELKRTQLYDVHVAAGATMVDFGGWEMPIQYPTGIVAEHLYTRSVCSLFDVSHMGRLLIEGPDRVRFLQHVLTSDVSALVPGKAQYCIISDADGCAIDDAYLYQLPDGQLLLVVNASNTEKDLAHLETVIKDFDCKINNVSSAWAAIAVQGPKSDEYVNVLCGGKLPEGLKHNDVVTMALEGHNAHVAKTGYTGEPLGFEIYIRAEDAAWLWNRLAELGAKPAGLGARDTLRLEASMPLYGHEMGVDADGKPMPIFAVPLAKFAVSFSEEKGDFIGKAALVKQFDAFTRLREGDMTACAVLPKTVRAIALIDRGVIRAGMPVYRGDEHIGWITSGTMVPYYVVENGKLTEQEGKRAIGISYIASDVKIGDSVTVDVRGRKLAAKIVLKHADTRTPPYCTPILL